MADYRKMYDSLFNDVTDTISLLQRAQQGYPLGKEDLIEVGLAHSATRPILSE